MSTRAPSLKPQQMRSIMQWLGLRREPEPFARIQDIEVRTDKLEELYESGAMRNALRHATEWGPVLVATLIEGGHLQPGDSPLDALNSLCGYNPETDS